MLVPESRTLVRKSIQIGLPVSHPCEETHHLVKHTLVTLSKEQHTQELQAEQNVHPDSCRDHWENQQTYPKRAEDEKTGNLFVVGNL